MPSRLIPALVACAAAACCAAAAAQTTGSPSSSGSSTVRGYGGDGWSLLPGTRRGYIGLNLGVPEYDLSCGSSPNLTCDDPDLRGHLYTGGFFNDWLGLELGYLNEGRADRGGGRTRAEGINLSLVARMPINQFSIYGKLGTTYGRTRVSAEPAAALPTGRDRGWGPAYAAGVGFDITPRSGLVLEWARHEFHFAGAGRQNVDSTSIGYVHRF